MRQLFKIITRKATSLRWDFRDPRERVCHYNNAEWTSYHCSTVRIRRSYYFYLLSHLLCPSISLSICPPVHLFISLSILLSVYPSVHSIFYLSVLCPFVLKLFRHLFILSFLPVHTVTIALHRDCGVTDQLRAALVVEILNYMIKYNDFAPVGCFSSVHEC